MSEITIRPFKPEDLPRLQDIAVRAWIPIYEERKRLIGEDLFNQLFPTGSECKREQLRAFAEQTPEHMVVAVDGEGCPVGFATFYINQESKIGTLCNNAVDKTSALKGVGQALYAEVFRRLKDAGMEVVQVNTGLDDAHAPARRAYERAGFDPVGIESVTYYKKL